jgi:flagellar hook protein FlgE
MGSTLLSSINIGRETLMSHGNAMATLSDNVSNSNTTGFKSGSAVFSDLLSSGSGSVANIEGVSGGDGTMVSEISSNLTQGALEQTNKPYDLAIDGAGYFTLAKPDEKGEATAELAYTRAGNFQIDSKGRLVNGDGFLVMSIPLGGGDGNLTPITLTGRDALPVATTTSTIKGNLDTEHTPYLGELPAVIEDTTTLQRLNPFSTAVRVIDSLGKPHDIGLSFFKNPVDPQGNVSWSMRAFANSDEVGGAPGGLVQVGTLDNITFGPNGVLAGTAATTLNATWSNGAAASSVALDLSGFTGYAKESFTSSTVTDGSIPGIAKSIGFDENGEISIILDTGERSPIGTLALARFPNELGLKRRGGTLFSPDVSAGEVQYDAPRAKGRGALQQATLETSNVDLAEQFVNLIRIQRSYQAGSQVIKTADELLNTTIQIA